MPREIKMQSKVDLFFIKLSIVNGFLIGLLMIILIKITHRSSITGNLLLDFFPSAAMFLGVWAFSKSKEVPPSLLLLARISFIGAFLGIVYLYPVFYKEWKAGVYDKPPYKQTSQHINSNL